MQIQDTLDQMETLLRNEEQPPPSGRSHSAPLRVGGREQRRAQPAKVVTAAPSLGVGVGGPGQGLDQAALIAAAVKAAITSQAISLAGEGGAPKPSEEAHLRQACA